MNDLHNAPNEGQASSLKKRRKRLRTPPDRKDEDWPYAVIFNLKPDFKLPSPVGLEKYRGLRYIEVFGTDGNQTGRLLTVWQCQQAYTGSGRKFRDDFGLADSSINFEGQHSSTMDGAKPLWRRITLSQVWAAVVTSFLVVGYLGQVRDASGWLVGNPGARASSSPAEADVLVGRKTTVHVKVRNIRSLGDCDISFKQPSVKPPDLVVISPIQNPEYPAIKPNGEADLELTVRAAQPGTALIECSGTATAGWLRPKSRTFGVSFPVHVWGRIEVIPTGGKTITHGGLFCELPYELAAGQQQPQGLPIRFVLTGRQKAQLSQITMKAAESKAGTNLDGTSYLELKTTPVEALSRLPFKVILHSITNTPLTEQDWATVVGHIDHHP